MAERTRFPVPPEVSNFFRAKELRPSFSWLDVWKEEHAYSFTVAKAVDVELLATFKRSIQTAIDNGQGFETWRAELLPELARQGWIGKRLVEDPQGRWAPKEVDFSSPRRLQTIFWSNVRAARAAGQWERAQRSKKALPYFVYVHTTALEPRAEHLQWVGLILPVDHPFWNTHFPPNGWGCKCSVRQTTRREAEKLLAQPGYTDDPGDFQRTVTFVNRRTGRVTQEPAGIDPGWGVNVGRARAQVLVDRLRSQLGDLPRDEAEAIWRDFVASPEGALALKLAGQEKDAQLAADGA